MEEEESVVPEDGKLIGEGDFWHGLNLKNLQPQQQWRRWRMSKEEPKSLVQNLTKLIDFYWFFTLGPKHKTAT